MAAAAPIPLELYLRSDYEPDAEYVDGEVEKRPMGEYDHSTWQQAIEQWFLQHAKQWNIRVRCELRVQVTPTRYRVPDVVVFNRDQPVEHFLTHPPIAVFEILSPEDTVARMLIKLEDYAQMGIRNVYVLDPRTERSFRYTDGELRRAEPAAPLTGAPGVVDWSEIAALRD
jgi:Uma2 family endonuclease